MFTLTTFSSSGRSSAILSSTGETAWHGPHHSAQKSTITALSLFVTSSSKVDSVTAVDIRKFLSSLGARYPRSHHQKRRAPGGCSLESKPMFAPLPDKPDHASLELAVLELWERERTFERLREHNAGGEPWSFMDGPI